MTTQRRIGILWVTLSASGYAFLPTLTRAIYAVSDFPPTHLALWRFMLATPLIWLLIGIRSRRKAHKPGQQPRFVLQRMGLGVFLAAGSLTAFIGLQYIPASLYIVLFFTYPAMVALLAVLLGSRLSAIAWLALALTLMGVVLTVPDLGGLAGTSALGIGIALLNALVAALYFTVSARILKDSPSMSANTAWIMTGTVVVLCVTVPFYGLSVPIQPQVWLLLLALAVVSTALPILLINIGIQAIGAPQAAIISAFELALSIVLAMVFLGEVILPLQWLGALLIITAVILLEARPARRKTTLPSAP